MKGVQDVASTTRERQYDVIVVGVGSMGSAACYYLSKSGKKVLGLDQYEVPHNQGSHSGQSRIIRKAYFEHQDYVPLLQRAYQLWKSIETELSTKLMESTGLLYLADSNHSLLHEVRNSAKEYGIEIQNFDAVAAAKNFPSFAIPSSFEAILEPEAGFVCPEKTIEMLTTASKRMGATFLSGIKVLSWSLKNGSVEVRTEQGPFFGKKVVLCSGINTSSLSKLLKPKLQVTAQLLTWVKPKKQHPFIMGNFPCWVMATNEHSGVFYGFPMLPVDQYSGPEGLKIAHHDRGVVMELESQIKVDESAEMEKLKAVLEEYIPESFDGFMAKENCRYTYSPDEDFILDFLPGTDKSVMVACGFSGHGFKFVPVIGEILSELAIEGKTNQPIGFLSLKRFL